MTTLAEVETAVERLPGPDQEALLRRLASKLRGGTDPLGTAAAAGREAWMSRLAGLRASLGSATPSVSAEDILDDQRSE